MYRSVVLFCLLFCACRTFAAEPMKSPGKIIHRTQVSQALAANKIGLNPARALTIYLPPDYEQSTRRYPVIYHIPNGNISAKDEELLALFDSAIQSGRIAEFIFVSGDFSIPDSLNFFGNGVVSGRWLDFVSKELLPMVDRDFRTIASPAGRALSGHFLGGYAAIRLGMSSPHLFGSVYALHPVGTDTGEATMLDRPNWKEIHSVQHIRELKAPYSAPFVAMAQAHSPNPGRPPLFADFMVEPVNGELLPVPANIRRLLGNFHLAALVPENAERLGMLKSLKFDWGRDDSVQAHVYGARKFSLLLKDFGIRHDADEYNGNGWEDAFARRGRYERHVLPFFREHFGVR